MPTAGQQGDSSASGTPGGGMPDANSGGMPGGNMPDANSGAMPGGSPGGTGDESLDEVFNKSLGDFDGEMERERSGMASSGQGSSQSADRREAGDATAGGGGNMDGPGGMVSVPSSSADGGMTGGGMAGGQASTSGDADSSDGQQSASGGGADGAPEAAEESEGNENAQVANVPDDIPLEGTAEDQVARQIREAAMAEKDPVIRDALWDEYRKHQGIK